MSTITRTLRNLWKVGVKDYFKQMNTIGDTKYGTLIGTDRFGNKFYENTDELPLRTKWVVYKEHYGDAAEIEPGWHAWLHYLNDKPPTEDAMLAVRTNPWSPTEHKPNYTLSRGAYKPYSTVKQNRIEAWTPQVKPREGASA